MNDEKRRLKNDKLKLKEHLKVTRDNNGVLKNMIALSEKTVEELKRKHKVSEMKADNLENIVEELETNQVKLVSDLESCKSSDANLVISQLELKECNQDLEAEANRNVQCESGRTICANTLENQVQINRNLQAQNVKLTESVEECQNKLIDEVEEKENLQQKLESVSQNICPSGTILTNIISVNFHWLTNSHYQC